MNLNNQKRVLILAVCMCATTKLISQGVPVPPLQGNLPPVLVTDQQSTTVTPDEHPLSGGQTLGLGATETRRSTLTPSLRISETLDSNPLLLSSNDGSYRGFTDFGAGVQWIQYMGRDAELSYSGAVRYDARARLQGYDQFTNAHSGAIRKVMQFRTWSLLLADEAQYSQGSNFGAAGMEGLGLMPTEIDLSGLQPAPTTLRLDLVPNQSVLIGRIGIVTNTALVELDKHFNSRSTATLEGSYGLMHFNSSLLTDANQTSLVAGYNRKLTASDTVALESAYTRFGYQQSDSSINTEYFSVLYARRITGRSSLELGAGPQVTQSQFLGISENDLGWQARGSIDYRMRRMSLSASAFRGITGGAGVLNGATSTTGQGSLAFLLSRAWSSSVSAGVSRNQQLDSAQKYDMQFASLVADRKFGRYTKLFVSYDLQHQSTASSCTGSTCGYVGVRNVFGIGFAWDYRPITVE